MQPSQVMTSITSITTKKFLEDTLVTIAGSTAPSGVLTYYVVSKGIVKGQKDWFKFNFKSTEDSANPFQAHSIQMEKRATMPGVSLLGGYVLPSYGGAHPGPSVMVTGMLTSCSFMYRKQIDGSALCAHIQANSNLALSPQEDRADITLGTKLQTELTNGGAFAGAAGPGKNVVFGHSFYKPHHATVLGVRRGGGGWDFYAQIMDFYEKTVLDVIELP